MRRTALALAAILLTSGTALAAEPLVPPPQGAALILEAAADGVQIYACEAQGSGFAWIFKAPEANLFDKQGLQVATHYAGPSWKLGDGSIVVGDVMAKADAPGGDSIPWLLLRAKSHDGTGLLSAASFIRRADTKGGNAPSGGCDATHKGASARVRYSALYQFFAAPK
jgi:Protein of unknown function (DUF3455)